MLSLVSLDDPSLELVFMPLHLVALLDGWEEGVGPEEVVAVSPAVGTRRNRPA